MVSVDLMNYFFQKDRSDCRNRNWFIDQLLHPYLQENSLLNVLVQFKGFLLSILIVK